MKKSEESLTSHGHQQLLVLLLIADLSFVVLHILYIYFGWFSTSLYSLSRDRGYAEFFQYTKELWIIYLLIVLAIRHRKWLLSIFSALFVYFLIDDSLELHEKLGEFLAQYFGFQPALGLRAVDFGELLVYGMFFLLFGISIALGYHLSDPADRRVARYLVVLVIILAGFGVFLDMIGIIVGHPEAERFMLILEEGGELLVMSVICWFVYNLNLQFDTLPFALKFLD